MERDQLQQILSGAGIDHAQWGSSATKTLDELLQEINEGECELVISNGGVRRALKTIGANLLYRTEAETLHLKEEKQIFDDGRSRRRQLDTSLGEKMLPGETPLAALQRALDEELGFSDVLPVKVLTKTKESKSYPGLLTSYTIFVFDVVMPDHRFAAEGYVKRDRNKMIYFVWETKDAPSPA